jgi:hypothetical protein
MGLPTFARQELRDRFTRAFSFALSTKKALPTVCMFDLMQAVKYLDKSILTKGEAIDYFVDRIKYILLSKESFIQKLVVFVDTKPIPVKRMVEHKKRYKNREKLSAKKGPYLGKDDNSLLPDWSQFSANYKLLQRELYPRLFNALMQLTLKPGQIIILSGFPGRSRFETIYGEKPWEAKRSLRDNQVRVVKFWDEDELPITKKQEQEDPDLYNRTYTYEHVAPCEQFPNGAHIRSEWEAAKCGHISEADIRMFHFEHWFQHENILFYINDGDVFAIGLLYAYERWQGSVVGGKPVFRNKHIACLPFKGDNRGVLIDGRPPEFEYCNLNKLFKLVREYKPFREAQVQNPAATMALLLIMAESDFFKDYCEGIGVQKGVWPVFFDNIAIFTHLIQLSEAVPPSTRTERKAVLDEELFRKFIYFVYLTKYEKKINNPQPTFELLVKASGTDAKGRPKPTHQPPDRNTARLWARQIMWNFLYWKNGPLGFYPDPFKTVDGIPYYPYVKDEQSGEYKMVDFVAADTEPIDDVFLQHMVGYKKRARAEGLIENQRDPEDLSEMKKRVTRLA